MSNKTDTGIVTFVWEVKGLNSRYVIYGLDELPRQAKEKLVKEVLISLGIYL